MNRKNNLISFLTILLTLGVVGGWIFSGGAPLKTQEAQASIEYLRPTAYTDLAKKTQNPLAAFDSANGATFSSTAYGVSKNPSITFNGWQTPSEAYADTYLKVRYHADAAKDDTYAIAYSTNGCTGTFTNLVAPTPSGASDRIVSSLDLGPSSNLSELCVKVYTQKVSKDDGKKLYIHDIWTEGAYTPKDSDGNLSSGLAVMEPVTISSIADTEAERTAVFDFTISDGGTSDGLPLITNQIVLHTSGTGKFNDLIWQLQGPDTNYIPGIVGENKITFNSLNISVPNGASEEYTIYAYFSSSCISTDGDTFILSIDGDTDLSISGNGTQIATTLPVDNGTGSVMDVLRTKLIFSTQPPASATVNIDFPGTVAVSAADVNNNIDKDFNEDITLSAVKDSDRSPASGILSSADAGGLTKTSVNGTAIWTDTKYDVQETMDIRAISAISYPEGIYSQPVVVGPFIEKKPVWCGFHTIHTNYSDGAMTQSQRITEMKEHFDCGSTNDHDTSLDQTEWTDLINQADENNSDNNFTYLFGTEWTDGQHIHYVTMNPSATAKNVGNTDFDTVAELAAWLSQNQGVAQHNHPARGSGSQTDFSNPATSDDTLIPLVEFVNQGAWHWNYSWDCLNSSVCTTYTNPHDPSGGHPEGTGWIKYALDNGHHLGFSCGNDYHGGTPWTPSCYTGLASPSNWTRSSVYETLKSRHTWAAEDKILVDLKYGQDKIMGDIFSVSESEIPVNYNIQAVDGQTITDVSLFLDGVITNITEFSSQNAIGSFNVNFADNNEHYVFIEAIQSNGKRAWSSPMYITYSADSPTISSAASQTFVVNQSATAISTITITDAVTPVITATNHIRIRIPAAFNMTWDTSDTLANIAGTDWDNTGAASQGAEVNVSWEDSNKTAVIPVTADFEAGDDITVYGLSFANFSAVSSADNLELETDNAGTTADTDDKTITVTTNEVTKSFQDGVYPTAGYNGTIDAVIKQQSLATNYGTQSFIDIDGDDPPGSGKDNWGVIKWDVSDIPFGSTVQSATITIYIADAGNAYPIYEMKRDWTETGATWNTYNGINSWETAGAQGATDRGTVSFGAIPSGVTGSQTIALNASGVAEVQDWINNPSANYGIVLGDSALTDGLDFNSQEAATASNRPKLTITY